MKTLALALAATLALPVAASAYCQSPGANPSFHQSCDQGVRIIRNKPLALPRIDPAQARQLELQRERLQLNRQRVANQYDIDRRRIALEGQRLNQTDYLYRDAQSPLRPQRQFFGGFGGVGFGAPVGFVQPRGFAHHRPVH